MASAVKKYAGHRSDPIPNLEFSINNDLVASKSYTCAFCEIVDALKDDRVNTIGVWGMGGVGKTTLVTAVGYTVKALQLFDKVIMVVVSQTPDIEKIQDKIADFLKLKYEMKTQQGKAGELWRRLEREEKVLIVLDDLWKDINLKEIGIPLGGYGKGCKTILTTRRKRVCEFMASQAIVDLGVLDKDEAWTLFKKKASLDEDKDDVDTIKLAKEVAKKCKGLPVAIITLASALKGANTVEEWKIARKKLESSRLMEIGNIKEEEKNAYICLETSYEHLKKDTAKKLFLLCAVYPEDSLIDPEDLARCAWGLNIYGNATSIEEVRVDVLADIKNLKDSCLLLEDIQERSESPLTWNEYRDNMCKTSYIKMHDMVRDVARWIASKEDNGFVTDIGVGPNNEIAKQKLEILVLDNYDDSKTPIDYFKGMPRLKVLSLSAAWRNGNVFSLNALEPLTDLRVLQLVGFERLEGFSALSKLKKLEILCLSGSSFQESIEKLEELTNLRVLDMRGCKFLLGFPPNLFRRLVKTEELYLYDSIIGSRSTAILSELRFLPKLESLSLKIPSLHFPQDFVFPRLQRYQIAMNPILWRNPHISSRFLMIFQGGLNVISELLWNVEFLEVSEIKEKYIKWLTDTTSGKVALAVKILQNLKLVSIGGCENLQVIFQMEKTENHALLLSKLKALKLRWLPNLEYIWKIPTQHVRLQSLEAIHLRQCGKLKSVFSFSLAQCLICLQLLVIESCDELKQIVEELEGDEQETSTNMNPNKSLCLPKLRTLEIRVCKRLEYIFPNFMASQGLPQLQKLLMDRLPQLKQICRPAMQREENSILLSQPQELLPSLTELKLRDCPELIDALVIPKEAKLEGVQLSKLGDALFANTKNLSLYRINGDHNNLIPEVDREGLNKLTVLKFEYCSSFEYLIDRKKENVPNSAFTNLTELHLWNLDGLKMLCNGQFPKGFLQNLKELKVQRCDELQELFKIDANWEENRAQALSNLEHCFNLQCLKVVNIYGCGKLKSLFSPSLIQSLLHLEQLQIKDCAELKTLFAESNSHLHSLCLPRLAALDISKCERLEYVLPITLAQGLPQLDSAKVVACPQLKQLFGGVAKEHDGVEKCIKLPHLRDLQLYELTNLSSFGPGNYLVKVPFLKELFVYATPQLTKFTVQQVHNLWVHLKKNLIPNVDVDPEGLTFLRLKGCEVLECLADTTKELAPTSGMFTNLVEVVMENVIGFKMLCNGQPPKGFLQNLEMLELKVCMDIVSLYPVAEKLQNLKVIKIKECNKLESLFSFSLIPSLRLLEKLWIIDCDSLEMVFSELESEGESEPNKLLVSAPILPRLQELHLRGLKNLSSFGPENYFITTPALKDLIVVGCPRLMNFSIQQDKPLQSKLPDEYNSKSNIETIELDDLLWLRDIWKCHIQVVVLTNLRKLEVYECNNLTYIFPMMHFRNLPQLWSLKIRRCEKVEQIIGDDDTSASSSSQGHDQLDETMAVKKEQQILMFSKLGQLYLASLPSLVSFNRVSYHLMFSSLDSLKIRNCPRMITNFTVDSISSVHAQTKAVKAPPLDGTTPSTPDISWVQYAPTLLPPYVEEADET
ncbi:hypothetical protein PTKIN_Ptkin14bG0008200 [Pterospermum kingtungense]